MRITRRWMTTVVTSFVLAAIAAQTQAADFGAWGKNARITFSGYTGPDPLTNFPVLVVLNTSIPEFSYADCRTGGADLRFADASGTDLPYEIDTWNNSGTSYVWVRVPLLTNSTDYIIAYWQNFSASAPTNAVQTWDAQHSGVYHFSEVVSNGGQSAGAYKDATVNARNADQNYTYNHSAGAVGRAVFSLHTDGGANNVRIPGTILSTNAWSKELWFQRDNVGVAYALFYGEGGGSSLIGLSASATVGRVYVGNQEAGTAVADSAALTPANWYHIVATYDASVEGGTLKLYKNGVEMGRTNGVSAPTNTGSFFLMSTGSGDFGAAPGEVDEVRASTVARSASWIKASYLTQASNASFQIYGSAAITTNANNLVVEGDTWRYHNTGALPGAGWYVAAFPDGSWSTGLAPLGYNQSVATTLSYGPDGSHKWATYYFRKHFNVANTASVTGLVASFMADDGAAIYLNGNRVHASDNLFEPPANDTYTTNAAFSDPFYVRDQFTINPSLLVNGDNVLAVEVHQVSATSSDVYFDLSLAKADYATTNQLGSSSTPPNNWTAYNDVSWQGGDVLGATVAHTRHSPGEFPFGGMLLSDSGRILPTSVAMTTNTGAIDFFAIPLTTNVAWAAGTDAANEFEGKIGRGYACQISAGAVVTVDLTGLKWSKQYKLIVWSSRVGAGYDTRYTDVTLLDADSFVNTSTVTAGVTRTSVNMPEDMTTVRASFMSVGTNYAPVARYEQIRPGANGTIQFTVKPNVASSGNGYLNAFKLVESDAAGYVDTNTNGMDDAWERAYFGGLSQTNGGALQDYDGDGSMNYDEYKAGTFPSDPGSALEFSIASQNTGTGMVLRWSSVSGKNYSILNGSNLVMPWGSMRTGIAATAPLNVATVTVSTARSFYRVRLD